MQNAHRDAKPVVVQRTYPLGRREKPQDRAEAQVMEKQGTSTVPCLLHSRCSCLYASDHVT